MVQTGIKGRCEDSVRAENTASHIGSGTAKVLSTPSMIALMEKTCRTSVKPYLEEGQETVGTRVDISHESASPVGMKIWCDSTLVEIDRRRLTFRVEAYDEKGLIGQGTHERFIIDEKRFQEKAQGKLS